MNEPTYLREDPPSYFKKFAISGKGAVEQHLSEEGARGFYGGVSALAAVVTKGLPFGELEALREQLDIPLDRLTQFLGLARATVHRRKVSGHLNADESDKVLRFARLLGQAAKVFGGIAGAREWLRAPQYGLGGAVPLAFAGTEVGAREVESLIGRIDHGVYS